MTASSFKTLRARYWPCTSRGCFLRPRNWWVPIANQAFRQGCPAGSPTKYMRLVSPNQPSLMMATSMLMMSPLFNFFVCTKYLGRNLQRDFPPPVAMMTMVSSQGYSLWFPAEKVGMNCIRIYFWGLIMPVKHPDVSCLRRVASCKSPQKFLYSLSCPLFNYQICFLTCPWFCLFLYSKPRLKSLLHNFFISSFSGQIVSSCLQIRQAYVPGAA